MTSTLTTTVLTALAIGGGTAPIATPTVCLVTHEARSGAADPSLRATMNSVQSALRSLRFVRLEPSPTCAYVLTLAHEGQHASTELTLQALDEGRTRLLFTRRGSSNEIRSLAAATVLQHIQRHELSWAIW